MTTLLTILGDFVGGVSAGAAFVFLTVFFNNDGM